MIEFLKNPNLNFIGARKFTYILSAFLVLNGLFAVYRIATGKARMSLDFTGGITVQLKFTKPTTIDRIRDIMTKNGINAFIQGIGPAGDMTYLIRVGTQDIKQENGGQVLVELLKKETGDTGLTVLEENLIGPLVSAQLKQKAVYAVIWAAIGILIYIWVRFKFKFAVAATIATIHDVLTVLGVMVLFGKEFDILVLTALLTIGGYSLTDTVVVFDRIRENMKHILKMPYDQLVNKSINEVLSRTIITSSTTMMVAISLFLFGGYVLNNFALAMVIGVIIGTYSSDLLASPIIVDWENYERTHRAVMK
jgi:preprotein translocase subunit SecF